MHVGLRLRPQRTNQKVWPPAAIVGVGADDEETDELSCKENAIDIKNVRVDFRQSDSVSLVTHCVIFEVGWAHTRDFTTTKGDFA
jgi:hypothetical protein